MDCGKFIERIHDVVDGELSASEEELLNRHIEGCAHCAAELRGMRALVALLGEMPLERTSVGFIDRVVQGLKAAGRIREPSRAAVGRSGWVLGWMKAVFATAMLFVVAVTAFRTSVEPLTEMVGEGTVLATGAYIELQEKAADVDMVTRVLGGVERILRAAKTVATAAVIVLATAGELLLLPALATMLVLTTGLFFFLRFVLRRGAEHATFSF